MSEALKSLNNIRTLRAQGRELPLEILEELLEKLSVVVEERRQEESSKEAELKARLEKIESLRQLMLEDGIDPEELLSSFSAKSGAPKKVREPRPAKYKYTDVNGKTKTWTGQGRTPKALAEQLEAGKTLDDFLI
ncbi:H-NS family nucleoid-associated regulatory protein [Salmonella enterica]|uniref:DNA-binding protein n=5 Tax=Salmonella enterica TaxID=28901 RepID=A0A718PTM9_SALTS|nr:H-NS family nucleoid-associated regulatory protein [Salmonella enterica]EHQ9219331.1 H-NS histone family protein [Salmonella enterica subsp. enterica serovar Rough:-]HAD3731983.1 DNA-binding protein [Salmonella enterica subsp. enterica serovar Typhi str. CT18]HAD6508973.1 DNA-binding protein [Salmonella enterica subsp. enterica serovar Typhimurium str. SL1344]HAD7191007.1 DNA-binding protein [Salmonella enterica subsp. enterica serovar Typhi str. 404ty]HBD6205111.1 H-NS histone family prote